jgi:hypothetical protein
VLDFLAPDDDRNRQRENDPKLATERFRVVAGVLVVCPVPAMLAVMKWSPMWISRWLGVAHAVVGVGGMWVISIAVVHQVLPKLGWSYHPL